MFHAGAAMDIEGPPDAGPGRPMLPRFEEHPRIPLRGPVTRLDGPRFEANEPHMRQLNEDFRGPPMEHDMHSLARPMPMGPGVPLIRSDRMLEAPPRLDDGSNPPFGYGRPVEEMPTPRTPPRQDNGKFNCNDAFIVFLLCFCSCLSSCDNCVETLIRGRLS